jgi:hypothetical protein
MQEREKIRRAREHEERFSDLCALSFSGDLSPEEKAELDAHLKVCPECREEFAEYSALAREGFPALRVGHEGAGYRTAGYRGQVRGDSKGEERRTEDLPSFEDSLRSIEDGVSEEMVDSTRQKLLRKIGHRPWALGPSRTGGDRGQGTGDSALGVDRRVWTRRALAMAAGVLFLVGASVASYRWGQKNAIVLTAPANGANVQLSALASDKIAAEELAAAETKELDRLRNDRQERERGLLRLQAQLDSVQEALSRTAQEKSASDLHLEEQREAFAEQIREKEQAYDKVQSELVHLKAEREKTLLQLTSLEQEIITLAAENESQRERIKSQDGYLTSDRDIRELMGARQLLIADIFDIANDQTRKPFGRVFYTKGKSLVFYAFDLDRQPHVKNASSFQVWGQKGRSEEHLQNLGILYMDNEANRRWALRSDDPAKLAEIDAVFVTIEPNGGSDHPTGKPFLYAYLKKDPNHP